MNSLSLQEKSEMKTTDLLIHILDNNIFLFKTILWVFKFLTLSFYLLYSLIIKTCICKRNHYEEKILQVKCKIFIKAMKLNIVTQMIH